MTDLRALIAGHSTALAAGSVLAYIIARSTARVVAWMFIALFVAAVIVYGTIVITQGLPATTSDRWSFAFVVAIPVLGLGLAVWLWARDRPVQR